MDERTNKGNEGIGKGRKQQEKKVNPGEKKTNHFFRIYTRKRKGENNGNTRKKETSPETNTGVRYNKEKKIETNDFTNLESKGEKKKGGR